MRIRTSWPKLLFGAGFLGLASWAVYWNYGDTLPQATAAPLAQAQPATAPPTAAAPAPSADYTQRVVAYIYGTTPITREMLGEYLIARMGAQRLDNLINKVVIEHECRKRNIEVTAGEVEAALQEDLKALNVSKQEFEKTVLKQSRKTLYEWTEDVVRVRLLMTKLCRQRVQVSEEDIQQAYEAHYGEKVDCRIILWPREEERQVLTQHYPKIRSNDEEFDRAARSQASATLAASGGKIRPVTRNSTGDARFEQTAFGLKPGELSHVVQVKEGIVVIKCEARIPANYKPMTEVREALVREVTEKKIHAEMQVVMRELLAQAKPMKVLKNYDDGEQLLRDVRQELPEVTPTGGIRQQSP